ncbi:MAG: hypothetical protein EP298_12525 [Gammaproteobacteria bacterium]|nr:MAG: hypothetical protein EP298_12525 [Gammaproteobacteria bacterium]UTW41810.1 hypothetical protein KFE69_09885 [bacterium SCSIO 12844]
MPLNALLVELGILQQDELVRLNELEQQKEKLEEEKNELRGDFERLSMLSNDEEAKEDQKKIILKYKGSEIADKEKKIISQIAELKDTLESSKVYLTDLINQRVDGSDSNETINLLETDFNKLKKLKNSLAGILESNDELKNIETIIEKVSEYIEKNEELKTEQANLDSLKNQHYKQYAKWDKLVGLVLDAKKEYSNLGKKGSDQAYQKFDGFISFNYLDDYSDERMVYELLGTWHDIQKNKGRKSDSESKLLKSLESLNINSSDFEELYAKANKKAKNKGKLSEFFTFNDLKSVVINTKLLSKVKEIKTTSNEIENQKKRYQDKNNNQREIITQELKVNQLKMAIKSLKTDPLIQRAVTLLKNEGKIKESVGKINRTTKEISSFQKESNKLLAFSQNSLGYISDVTNEIEIKIQSITSQLVDLDEAKKLIHGEIFKNIRQQIDITNNIINDIIEIDIESTIFTEYKGQLLAMKIASDDIDLNSLDDKLNKINQVKSEVVNLVHWLLVNAGAKVSLPEGIEFDLNDFDLRAAHLNYLIDDNNLRVPLSNSSILNELSIQDKLAEFNNAFPLNEAENSSSTNVAALNCWNNIFPFYPILNRDNCLNEIREYIKNIEDRRLNKNYNFTNIGFKSVILPNQLSNYNFSNVDFESCGFQKNIIKNCTFKNVKFSSNMENVAFENCTFSNCEFGAENQNYNINAKFRSCNFLNKIIAHDDCLNNSTFADEKPKTLEQKPKETPNDSHKSKRAKFLTLRRRSHQVTLGGNEGSISASNDSSLNSSVDTEYTKRCEIKGQKVSTYADFKTHLDPTTTTTTTTTTASPSLTENIALPQSGSVSYDAEKFMTNYNEQNKEVNRLVWVQKNINKVKNIDELWKIFNKFNNPQSKQNNKYIINFLKEEIYNRGKQKQDELEENQNLLPANYKFLKEFFGKVITKEQLQSLNDPYKSDINKIMCGNYSLDYRNVMEKYQNGDLSTKNIYETIDVMQKARALPTLLNFCIAMKNPHKINEIDSLEVNDLVWLSILIDDKNEINQGLKEELSQINHKLCEDLYEVINKVINCLNSIGKESKNYFYSLISKKLPLLGDMQLFLIESNSDLKSNWPGSLTLSDRVNLINNWLLLFDNQYSFYDLKDFDVHHQMLDIFQEEFTKIFKPQYLSEGRLKIQLAPDLFGQFNIDQLKVGLKNYYYKKALEYQEADIVNQILTRATLQCVTEKKVDHTMLKELLKEFKIEISVNTGNDGKISYTVNPTSKSTYRIEQLNNFLKKISQVKDDTNNSLYNALFEKIKEVNSSDLREIGEYGKPVPISFTNVDGIIQLSLNYGNDIHLKIKQLYESERTPLMLYQRGSNLPFQGADINISVPLPFSSIEVGATTIPSPNPA